MRTPLRRFHLLVASGAMFLGFAAPDASRAQQVAPPSLYALLPAEARSPGSAAATSGRRVRQGVRGLALAASPRLRVPLPGGRIVDVQRVEQRSLDKDGHYWRGHDATDRTVGVRVVVRGSVVVGTIEAEGRTYLLAPDAAGSQMLDDITTTGVRCGGALVPAVPLIAPGAVAAATTPSQAVSAALGDPVVELLVVYSSETRAAAGGADAIRATIDLAVEATNEALANSLVPARLRLVDVREVSYVESRSLSVDLDRVTEIGDGAMDDVHAWRDAAGADLVSLIVERNNAEIEGIAWLMQAPSVDFAPNAFSVVMRRTAVSLTLAHEVGHNLGLAHDPANADAIGAYPYAQGYRDPPYFRDVMSYPCPGVPCPLVPYFSTPDVLYAGRPMGNTAQDNARALRLTMPVAAAFRSGAALTLTGVSPSTIGTLGGTQLTLQGTRLSTVVRVLVDGVPATDMVALPSGALAVTMPRHPHGPATIVIEDDAGGQASRVAAVTYVASAGDLDGDALEDDWERAMGLDPTVSDGAAGAAGDPDGDGVSNLRERLEHGHPRGQYRRYFAEGAQGAFFATQLALLNPGPSATGAVVRVLGANGTVRSLWRDVPARTRRTLTAADIATLGVAEFSIVVESASPLVVDRTMSWTAEPYGAHAESSIAAPALRWFLAEGATTGTFNLFYLLQNPNAQTAQVRVRYLRQSGAPLERTYLLPPSSRTNVWVNQEQFPGLGRALAAAEVSADIEVLNGQPIVVERAMYRDVPAQPFGAGHVSAAATTAGTEWFMAEGATGTWFDFFILIANPTATAATAEITYLLPDGSTIVRAHVVPAASRYTVWVDQEDPRLADSAVSASVRITNDVPVVVERSMWWPNGSASWHEAHNAVASRTTATRWALAEGEVGGTPSRDTYVLIANTSGVTGTVGVTLLFEDGTSASRSFVVVARSRFNVDVRSEFAQAAGRRFGVIVESTGGTPVQLVVERAMYWDASGQRWAAGTNAVATPLP